MFDGSLLHIIYVFMYLFIALMLAVGIYKKDDPFIHNVPNIALAIIWPITVFIFLPVTLLIIHMTRKMNE